VYEHEWMEGDALIWDNMQTIHAATPLEDGSHAREMWRTTVAS